MFKKIGIGVAITVISALLLGGSSWIVHVNSCLAESFQERKELQRRTEQYDEMLRVLYEVDARTKIMAEQIKELREW